MLNLTIWNSTAFDILTVWLWWTELFEIELFMYKNGFGIK